MFGKLSISGLGSRDAHAEFFSCTSKFLLNS